MYQDALQRGLIYPYASQILQHFQDLNNVKRFPNFIDTLEICTEDVEEARPFDNPFIRDNENLSDDDDAACPLDFDYNCMFDNIEMDSGVDLPLGNVLDGNKRSINIAENAILNVTPAKLQMWNERDVIQSIEMQHEKMSQSTFICNRRTSGLITIITKALAVDMTYEESSNTTNEFSLQSNALVDRKDIESLERFAHQQTLDIKQKLAFQTICASFMFAFTLDHGNDLTTDDKIRLQTELSKQGALQQLLFFLTGPGGGGKSHVINSCRMYCKSFCDAIGTPFDSSVFVVTASSNSAASLLGGKTIHSVAMLNCKRISNQNSEVNWGETKMLVIDEISMTAKSILPLLDNNLRILTERRDQMYGGLNIVFAGDFSQLPPVKGLPIYDDFEDILWHGALNGCVFLDKGNHRFALDFEYGEIMQRVQMGCITEHDLALINERVVPNVSLPMSCDCSNVKATYACYTNKCRNRIANECFANFVSKNNPPFYSIDPANSSAIIIKGLISKQGRSVGEQFHYCVWSLCGDADVESSQQQKVDPCLKLFAHCPVMITTNTNKQRGIYKGTTALFVGLKWKRNHNGNEENIGGIKVLTATVDMIESLVLRLDGPIRASSGSSNLFEVAAETFKVKIQIPHESNDRTGAQDTKMVRGLHITQFPINCSIATTGHKLQGMTKDILIVAETTKNVANWLYVVLSRVTSRQGLFLLQPLTMDMFVSPDWKLQREIRWLRNHEKQLFERLNVEWTEPTVHNTTSNTTSNIEVDLEIATHPSTKRKSAKENQKPNKR